MKMFRVYLDTDICDISSYTAYIFVYAANSEGALSKVLSQYPEMEQYPNKWEAVEVKDFHIEYKS